jgi:hypothetical protein
MLAQRRLRPTCNTRRLRWIVHLAPIKLSSFAISRHCEELSDEANRRSNPSICVCRRLGLASMLAQRRLRPTCNTRRPRVIVHLAPINLSSFAISRHCEKPSLRAKRSNPSVCFVCLLRRYAPRNDRSAQLQLLAMTASLMVSVAGRP